METATRPARPPARRSDDRPSSRAAGIAVAVAGPALIVASVVIAMRGFAFLPRLSNQHSDVLAFWLPRSCLMGDALTAGRVPLWNPFEMAGTPFAADAQSGWLSAPAMSFSLLGCGDGLRALIVAYPILAGLGLWWFLRRERLGRVAATAGGLSLAMAIAASGVAISLPFAGFLAWTPFALVGASGFFSARGWRRLPWLALAAFAWGQVATAHLSHGLAISTALLVAYVVARALRDVRADDASARTAAVFAVAFLAFIPLANLAILVPRLDLIARSSLRAGYGALQGSSGVDAAAVADRPLPDHGIWSGWPLALASTPGAYLGAAILLGVPFAIRDRARRFLVWGIGLTALVAYLLTLTLFVGAGWFRALVLHLPFGDVYLHNPGRLRYAAYVAVPILGALGVQSFLDDRRPFAAKARTLAIGLGVFALLPLAAGANPERLIVFAVGAAAIVGVAWALARGRRWATVALAGVLAAELLAGALWSSAYRGGTVYFGLEGEEHPALVHGPLRWPRVDLDRYLQPGPIARAIAERNDGRYLAWVPPAAYFHKGYLFTQDDADWPALLLGRAVVFGLHDALGYSPIQVTRYWSYIRATNRLPVFYNAAVIQLPTPEDVRLLGVRYLVTHEAQQLPADVTGRVVASERGYVLYELDGAQPRVSVVQRWTVVEDAAEALEVVTTRGFDPAGTAVVETDPGIVATAGSSGSATYTQVRPEDVWIHVRATAPSLVVVRNAWERGWEATLDGSPKPVLVANAFLQAVAVPAGEHRIRLTYRDPAIGRGLAGSAIAWFAFAAASVAVLVTNRRRARRRPAPPRAA
jgi:hypothetical protein